MKLFLLFVQVGLAASAVAAVAVVMATVAAAAVVAATSAAVVTGLELLGGSVAHELYISAVADGLTGQLVVEVHEHLVVGHLDYLTVKSHALLSHHGHDSTGSHALGIKLAVHVEDFLLELTDEIGVLLAEGLLGSQCEVEFFILIETHDVILEFLKQRNIESEHKSVGMFLIEFEYTGLLLAVHNKDLINELHIFSCFDFHICYCLVLSDSIKTAKIVQAEDNGKKKEVFLALLRRSLSCPSGARER